MLILPYSKRSLAAICIAILAVLAIVVVAGTMFLGHGNVAEASRVLMPNGICEGMAIVIYDPGASGEAETAATMIAELIRSRTFTVTLAGIKSPAAANLTGYDLVVVVGGPVSSGSASAAVEDYVTTLNHSKVHVFGTLQGSPADDEWESRIRGLNRNVGIVKTLTPGDGMDDQCKLFVGAIVP